MMRIPWYVEGAVTNQRHSFLESDAKWYEGAIVVSDIEVFPQRSELSTIYVNARLNESLCKCKLFKGYLDV